MSTLTSAPAAGRSPRRARRRLITLGIALAGSAGIAGVAAPSAFASGVGGVNMNSACISQYSQPNAYAEAGANVYTWLCYVDGSDLGGINVTEQCIAQYGVGSTAEYSNYSDPYSWYCTAP